MRLGYNITPDDIYFQYTTARCRKMSSIYIQLILFYADRLDDVDLHHDKFVYWCSPHTLRWLSIPARHTDVLEIRQ